ncbi:MAG: glycosyltransferase family 39 protein [Candidatus Daviesbacteria bacterium]|nr:glycosyltransferase family 39 protein [Candidatus Daviesbacteria bacterium]
MNLKNLFQQTLIFYVILFVLIIPTFYSLLRPGFFTMQDDLQAFRIFEMNTCFQDGQFPCRWVPDAGFGYGYPLFNYYAPGIFYLGNILHGIGWQIIDSVKIIFILGFVLAPFSMYLFLNSFLNKWAAVVGSVLYAYAPFRAQEVYVRGAISEFSTLIFFPLLFWAAAQLIKTDKWKYFFYLSLFLGLFLLTHNLMAVVFIPILIIWILFLLITGKKMPSLKVFSSILLGFGLAAFFWLPVIFEKQFAHTETLLGGYFDYRQHFVNLYELFISNHWGYGSSVLGPNDDLNLSAGQVHWILSVLTFLLAVVTFKKNRNLSLIVFFLAVVELILLFLMHQKSSFVWSAFPTLAYLQFPWRLLALSSFLLSILGAIGIFILSKFKINYIVPIFSIVIISLTLIMYANFFHPKDWYNLTDQEKFSGVNWEKQLTTSIFDYLPIYAKLPPKIKAPNLPEVLGGSATFENYIKGSNFQSGIVDIKKAATLRLPLFDFPGMTIFIDGQMVGHNHTDCRNEEFCLGLITFDISTGQHTIKAILEDTPVRSIGNYLTVFSGVAFILILLKNTRFKNLGGN